MGNGSDGKGVATVPPMYQWFVIAALSGLSGSLGGGVMGTVTAEHDPLLDIKREIATHANSAGHEPLKRRVHDIEEDISSLDDVVDNLDRDLDKVRRNQLHICRAVNAECSQ